MNPTLNHESLSPALASPVSETNAHTIVLQPEQLDSSNCQEFQRSLETALAQATHAVVVDFLWLRFTDDPSITALVTGIETATATGKALSFQSMTNQTRTAIEVEWNRRCTVRYGAWSDRFAADLEQFLEQSGRFLRR